MSSATVLKHRDLGHESRQRLLCLFRQGHSPSSALHCLKTELKIKHGDDYNRIAADTYYVPSFSVVHKLYRSECRTEVGSCYGENMALDLQAITSQYCKERGGTAKFGRVDDNCFVAICSPLMARVHELVAKSSELVMVDVVVGRQDRCPRRIYSFLTPSPAGMLPLGVIITESQRELVFEASLCCLKSCFPEKSFFGRGSPQIFLVDNDMQERQALERVFASSRVLFGHLHMLKTVWSWLCDAKNNIHKSHQRDLYSSFKSVLYAETEADMINQHLFLVSSYAFSLYSSFACYYGTLWNLRSRWALALRSSIHTAASCIEVTFRIWKNCVMDRITSFGMPQMFGFVCSCYELYVEKRVLDFCNGSYQKSLLKNLMCDKTDMPDSSTVTAVDEQSLTYSVRSLNLSEEVYTVELQKEACSCYAGCVGKLCGHIRAVLLKLDESLWIRSHSVSAETKQILFRVASGIEPPLDWLSSNVVNVVYRCDDTLAGDTCSDVDVISDNISGEVADKEIEQFCNMLCVQMKDSLQKVPHVFVPAFQQMRASMAAFSTDGHFPNALHAFQYYTSTYLTTQKYVHVGECEQHKTSVQIDIKRTVAGKHKTLR